MQEHDTQPDTNTSRVVSPASENTPDFETSDPSSYSRCQVAADSQRWFLHLLVAWLDTRTTGLGRTRWRCKHLGQCQLACARQCLLLDGPYCAAKHQSSARRVLHPFLGPALVGGETPTLSLILFDVGELRGAVRRNPACLRPGQGQHRSPNLSNTGVKHQSNSLLETVRGPRASS
jgi:hypothetical protein